MVDIIALPTELQTKILETLDSASLVVCRRVCRLFQYLIKSNTSLQYIIELAVCGSEDGEYSNLSVAVRLELLKKYRSAWDTQVLDDEISISMDRGGLWELYGNVLAQNSEAGAFSFVQLPSKIRSIEQRQWVHQLDTPNFPVRDFTVDASQDLVVLVQAPDLFAQNVLRIHLRTLSTGAKHPLAPRSGAMSHFIECADPNDTYDILVSGDHLGIFVNGDIDTNSLIVWNWKGGNKKLNIVSDEVRSFMFFSSTEIIVLVLAPSHETHNMEASLRVIDFECESKVEQDILDVENVFIFQYPASHPGVTIEKVTLRSDPAPLWTPGPKLSVPFHLARNNRAFVISFWAILLNGGAELFVHFVLADTLRSCLDLYKRIGRTYGHIDWEHWGPKGTRMARSPSYHSRVWVCYVYGSRYVLPRRTAHRQEDDSLQWKCSILLYDFNQLGFRRALQNAQSRGIECKSASYIPEDEETCFVTEEGVLEAGLFAENVRTSLPYRVRSIPINMERRDGWTALCSEDGIIIVDTREMTNLYRVLTF